MERQRPRSASRPVQANQVFRAMAMPLVGHSEQMGFDGPNDNVNFQAIGTGVSYVNPKLGTQSYSAGTLTKR